MSRYDDLKETIETIFNWAAEHSEFDPEFVKSLSKQLEDRGTLSDKQKDALHNIVEKWNMEEE